MTKGMTSLWLNDWKDDNRQKLEASFGLVDNELNDIELLLASYKEGDDSGYAFILFRSNQLLYEVNASHDSEFDLLGQWLPEETSIEALLHRINVGNLGSAEAGDNLFAEQLKELLLKLIQ